MSLILIWAEDENRVIGKDKQLPWSVPEDLEHFKETTLNHTIVMGPVTFEGFKGRILPKRKTVVWAEEKVTSEYLPNEKVFVLNEKEILSLSKNEKVFIVGGKATIENFEDYADEMIITKIKGTHEGDTYGPEIKNKNWRTTEIKELSDKATVYYHKKLDIWKV